MTRSRGGDLTSAPILLATPEVPAMNDLISAALLAIALEGALYALFPDRMKEMLERVREMPSETLRAGGLAALAVGVFLLWLVRA